MLPVLRQEMAGEEDDVALALAQIGRITTAGVIDEFPIPTAIGPWGIAAGLLFALYPFSYEAVPYVGSFVHPLVTFLILLSLAFFFHWWRGGPIWAFIGAHIALILAVFTQENAVITPLLVVFATFRFGDLFRRRLRLSRERLAKEFAPPPGAQARWHFPGRAVSRLGPHCWRARGPLDRAQARWRARAEAAASGSGTSWAATTSA